MKLRFVSEAGVDPARALSVGALFLEQVARDGAPPVLLYGASLSGEAVALGRSQRAAFTLDREACARRSLTVLRRTTGGPAAMAKTGILYAALALRHASVLMDCPRDRVLNRNVRGFLAGLGALGARSHYFGREHLAVEKRPAALVSWTRRDGAVLLEVFLSSEKTYGLTSELSGYPTPKEQTTETKEPITLAEALGRVPPVEDIVRAIAEGHRDTFEADLELERASLADEDRAGVERRMASLIVDLDASDELVWSALHSVPIGWVAGGVKLAGDGTIEDVEVAGDFYDDDGSAAHLRGALAGKVPTREALAAAAHATWDGATRSIEGLRDLEPIVAALTEAVASATAKTR